MSEYIRTRETVSFSLLSLSFCNINWIQMQLLIQIHQQFHKVFGVVSRNAVYRLNFSLFSVSRLSSHSSFRVFSFRGQSCRSGNTNRESARLRTYSPLSRSSNQTCVVRHFERQKVAWKIKVPYTIDRGVINWLRGTIAKLLVDCFVIDGPTNWLHRINDRWYINSRGLDTRSMFRNNLCSSSWQSFNCYMSNIHIQLRIRCFLFTSKSCVLRARFFINFPCFSLE